MGPLGLWGLHVPTQPWSAAMFLRGRRKHFCHFLFQNSDFNPQILVFLQNSDLKSEILGGSKLSQNSDFFLRLKSKTAKDQSPHLFWLLSKRSWAVWHQSEVFLFVWRNSYTKLRRPGFLCSDCSCCIFQETMHSDTLHCFCQKAAAMLSDGNHSIEDSFSL